LKLDEVFRLVAPLELERLGPYGFDEPREGHGPGFTYESFVVFSGSRFVRLVREIRDQLIYCELGTAPRRSTGPSLRGRDLRELLPRGSELGAYEETEAGIRAAIREVVDAIIDVGVPYLSKAS
jgi:hypothetical protein